MLNAPTERDRILRNLQDAGCDENIMNAFFQITGEKKTERRLLLLGKHRKQLLSQIHETQKQIDCLDYLMFEIEKRQKTNNEAGV